MDPLIKEMSISPTLTNSNLSQQLKGGRGVKAEGKKEEREGGRGKKGERVRGRKGGEEEREGGGRRYMKEEGKGGRVEGGRREGGRGEGEREGLVVAHHLYSSLHLPIPVAWCDRPMRVSFGISSETLAGMGAHDS
jgi:hypothetical protein